MKYVIEDMSEINVIDVVGKSFYVLESETELYLMFVL